MVHEVADLSRPHVLTKNDQGHPCQLAMEIMSVLEGSVVPELLAMIRRHHDESLVPPSPRFQSFYQQTERSIGRQDLSVVQCKYSIELFGRWGAPPRHPVHVVHFLKRLLGVWICISRERAANLLRGIKIRVRLHEMHQ